MGHVGLKAESAGPIYAFEEVDHFLPTMDAAPADFAFGGEAFAEAFSHVTRFAERLDNPALICISVFGPFLDARSGINPHDAIRSDTEFAQFRSDTTRFPDLVDEFLAIFVATHGGAATGRRPYGGDHGPNHKPSAGDFVRQLFDSVVVDINAGMRIEKEKVHAIEANPIDFGFGGKVEHRVQVDTGLGAGA